MGKPTGFQEFIRQTISYREPLVRIGDYKEIYTEPAQEHLMEQGARCMDCGVPFCQSNSGCPIDNLIPEWNDLVFQGRFKEAIDWRSLLISRACICINCLRLGDVANSPDLSSF